MINRFSCILLILSYIILFPGRAPAFTETINGVYFRMNAPVENTAAITREQKALSWFTLRFFIVMICCLAAILLFAYLAQSTMKQSEIIFDSKVFTWIQQFESPATTRIAAMITFLGSGPFLIPVYVLLLVWLLWRKRYRDAIVIGMIATISYLMGSNLKNVFQRQRPSLTFLETGTSGFSFPSGHSLGGFTLSGILIYLVWRSKLRVAYKWVWSVLLLIHACFIGLSRIYLHVHFASDVLASFFIAVAWLTLSFEAAYFFKQRSRSARL
jgi:undecaprenyl-diphosphatase